MRFALLILSVSCGLLGSSISGRAATDIPFVFRAGTICLKVDAAGHSEPLNFLLDSGAGKSVVHLATARRLGVKLGARETVRGVQGRCSAYRVDGFAATLGAVPVPDELLALDLSAVAAGCGMRIDGLLGADFFRAHIVQIDFAARKLRLFQRGETAAQEGRSLPLSRRGDAFCVRVAVNRGPAQWVRLDTGYSGALEWVVTSTRGGRAAGTSIAATGSPREHLWTEVELGSEHFPAVKTGVHSRPIFAGEDGLIGNGLLSHFRVTVDAARSRLSLLRVTR